MGKKKVKSNKNRNAARPKSRTNAEKKVTSLLDEMKDEREYESIVSIKPERLHIDVTSELRRAISEIETIRQRPLMVYVANLFKPLKTPVAINSEDDVPVGEMLSLADNSKGKVDILIATPGGGAAQVSKFVNYARQKFNDVTMIIPNAAMSAGTIWALSGNNIIMDERATLGPIDPQVMGRSGRFLPAQALIGFINDIQSRGEQAIKNGGHPRWADVLLLKTIDAKEIGDALALTDYSIKLATEYLRHYKFRDWDKHGDERAVTAKDKDDRALEIAQQLAAHDRWKLHGHGLNRDVLWDDLKIKIEHPEETEGLSRAIRRMWAFVYWAFTSTQLAKIIISSNYGIFKHEPQTGAKK